MLDRVVISCLLLFPLTALAGDHSAQDAALRAGDAATMAAHCEADITPSIDWASFEPALGDDWTPDMAVNRCNSVANGVYWTCDDDAGKASVGAAVTALRCVHDDSVTDAALGRKGPGLSLTDGVLEARYNPATTDIEDATRLWLSQQLKPPGGANSLHDTRAIDTSVAYYFGSSSYKALAEDRCGKPLPADIRWTDLLPHLGGNITHDSAVKWCDSVYEGVWGACDTDAGRALVSERVSSVACTWDAAATAEALGRKGPSLSLTDGVLRAGYHWDSTDIGDSVRDWLVAQP